MASRASLRSHSAFGGADGRAIMMAATTERSIAAASAAVFQSPSAGITKNPAAATPATAPAVLIA